MTWETYEQQRLEHTAIDGAQERQRIVTITAHRLVNKAGKVVARVVPCLVAKKKWAAIPFNEFGQLGDYTSAEAAMKAVEDLILARKVIEAAELDGGGE